MNMQEPNTKVSSLSLYVGIPTAEFRTIQGQLAQTIGTVLSIADERRIEVRPNWSGAETTYVPFLGGATAFGSVFGYWTQSASRVRVDDHSEVIQFLLHPDRCSPSILTVISEVVYPALTLARQDSVLAVIQHPEYTQRLSCEARLKLSHTGALLPRARRNPEETPPIEFLVEIAAILGLGTEEPKHLAGDLVSGWNSWLVSSGHGEAARVQSLKDPATGRLRYGYHTIHLPTMYLRMLVTFTSWWLLYGSSSVLKVWSPIASTLWQEKVARRLLQLLDAELDEMERAWMTNPDSYTRSLNVRIESSDPLPAALLWLAFVRDLLAHNVDRLSALEDHRVKSFAIDGLLQGVISDAQSPEAVISPGLRFDSIANKLTDRQLPKRYTAITHQYWLTRLNLLSSVNGSTFPDDHLLDSWRLFFTLVTTPNINYYSESRRDLIDAPSVQWPATPTPAWWRDLERRWHNARPCARFWLAPLLTERVFWSLPARSRGRTWDSFFAQGSAHVRDMRILRSLAEQSISGFPLRLPIELENAGLPSRFVALGQDALGL
jgi:hypothetical protein